MFAQYHCEPYQFSSACPCACSVVAFAARVGGKIDPEFLMQCQILDPKFQKAVDSLKAVPLNFEATSDYYNYQENIFIDIGAPNPTQFYDPWQFKQFNSWIGSGEQLHSTLGFDSNDIVIDFI
ncbi:unnamed protein product [Adineta ricciae]|uniref:Uncharacterized protein n=1 Tax=Adineta ricciae TaxID=249248 RepID=A0A815F9X1_ADIRI|nr:unnamed protein product [Adineta ricciae]CAF1481904.1 unnamed protein product [Adineta ricciae]